jgi:hypothetical protein
MQPWQIKELRDMSSPDPKWKSGGGQPDSKSFASFGHRFFGFRDLGAPLRELNAYGQKTSF